MTLRPVPTEPRNPKSRCATCEHLGLNGYYPCLHCYMRDIDIYKGYTRCSDYEQKQTLTTRKEEA